MKKLQKEKQKQLLLVGLVIAAILVGLWYGLIRAQQQKIQTIASEQAALQSKLAGMKNTIARAEEIEQDLAKCSGLIASLEGQMASGDLYAWMVTALRQFKLPYNIDIPQFSQIEGPREMNLLPGFPYAQSSMTIAGSGNFYEVGRFIADFENKYPFSRINNLTLDTSSGGPLGSSDRLTFNMSVITLVKPAS